MNTMRVSLTLQDLHDVANALAARERVLHVEYMRAGTRSRDVAYAEVVAVATLREKFEDLIDAMREGA